MHLEVEEIITEDIIAKLKHGALDAGIVSTPVKVSGIHFKPLFYEQFFLYVSDKHPLYVKNVIDLNDFDPEDLWYLKEGNCFQNQVNAICRLAETPIHGQNLIYFSNSIESLRRIVETRKGMTFIPELATAGIAPEYEDMVKPLTDPRPVREISLAVSRVHWKKRLVETFIQVALESLPERMKTKQTESIIDTHLKLN